MKNGLSVIDSSFLVSLLLPKKSEQKAKDLFLDQVANKDIVLIAPDLLVYECGNVVKNAIRRRLINEKAAKEMFADFSEFDIRYCSIDIHETLNLCLKTSLTYYDAAYCWLALDQKATLLTYDEELMIAYKKLRSS